MRNEASCRVRQPENLRAEHVEWPILSFLRTERATITLYHDDDDDDDDDDHYHDDDGWRWSWWSLSWWSWWSWRRWRWLWWRRWCWWWDTYYIMLLLCFAFQSASWNSLPAFSCYLGSAFELRPGPAWQRSSNPTVKNWRICNLAMSWNCWKDLARPGGDRMWQDLLGHERRFWKHQLQTKKQKTHHKQTIKQQQTHFLQLNKLNLSFFMGETQLTLHFARRSHLRSCECAGRPARTFCSLPTGKRTIEIDDLPWFT